MAVICIHSNDLDNCNECYAELEAVREEEAEAADKAYQAKLAAKVPPLTEPPMQLPAGITRCKRCFTEETDRDPFTNGFCRFCVKTKTQRFRNIHVTDAFALKFPNSEQFQWNIEHQEWHWCLYEFNAEGAPIALIGIDGGEPEDQILIRDWTWVAEALEAKQQEIERGKAALIRYGVHESENATGADRDCLYFASQGGRDCDCGFDEAYGKALKEGT